MKKIFTILVLLSFIGLNSILAQTVTDIDGNVYNTVTIGTQVWMKENLKTTKYRDGSSIPNVTDGPAWNNLTSGAYCNYNNDTNNTTTYGRLYNWYAVSNSRNIAPTGWHVPTDAEWNILEKFLDNTVDTTATGYVGTDIGGKLKETGTSHWNSPNTGATNSSGFSALPGGNRNFDGLYSNIGNNGGWWSATAYTATHTWERYLVYDNSQVFRYLSSKRDGYLVRCLRDFAADIKEIKYFEKIKIYPNPSNDIIEIEGIQNFTIEIINIQGQIVKSLIVSNNEKIIDISKLLGGVYIMKIITDDRIFVKKLIKNN